MIIFALKSALTLALLYCVFFAMLGRETFHRFNRFALVGIMIVSLVVPMIHVTTAEPTLVSEQMTEVRSFIEPEQLPVVASIPIKAEDIVLSRKDTSEPERTLSFPLDIDWASLIALIYIIGIAWMFVVLVLRSAMLVRLLRGGLRHTDSEGNTVILRSGDIAPFSVFRYIVMSVSDYENHRQHILTHEQAHIRLGHTYDLLLVEAMKVLQWFNPFIWFLARDLEAVHEYEADEAVINKGIDATKYQQLLVVKAVGNRLQPFANNLNHSSLKRRFIMMHKTKSPGAMMLKVLFAIPVVAFAIYAFATPETGSAGTATALPSQVQPADNTQETAPLVGYTANSRFGKGTRSFYWVNLTEGVLVENIPVRHYTDAELRQWAQAEKAKGTSYDKLYDTMAPNGMTCADVKKQWHIVRKVYGKK